MIAPDVARAGRMVRRGIRYGYPWCCVARFAWDVTWNRSPGTLRGRDGARWVPCGVIHR